MDNYVGKRLDGRYELQEVIGVGGMAVVYKAYDNIDDRTVAVKILKDEFLASEEFRRRFKNESKAIAVLSHPNIVKVYDGSYGDKLQYIVMEYVEGITLKEYIEQQGVISWKETVHFTTQILRALQHAHDKGIVHRDIKPQNIMLLENGTIKVTDFGIARFSRSETRTMTDTAIGSVHYISPEQARGDITDDKSDIYSVGVVMYEMLTGQLPFQSDNSVSVAIMQLQTDPVKPREINSSIPEGLEQITMRAMQKNPKDRYQSAAEMILDLEEFKRNPAIKFDYSYFVDNELDGVMNYPLQKAILRYVRRENDGAEFGQQVMTLAENYPPHVLNACMNLLSTHDTPRAINALLDPHGGSRDDLARRHFSPDQIIWGKELLRTAAFLQFTLPGAPCIYYGDEAGMTGYRDPFNRGFYPWGEEDTNLQAFYRALARLKRENPALKTGRVEFITASNGRVQFLRQSAGQTAMVFCNASREPWRVQYAGKLLFGGKLQAYTPEAVTLGENGFCVMV